MASLHANDTLKVLPKHAITNLLIKNNINHKLWFITDQKTWVINCVMIQCVSAISYIAYKHRMNHNFKS